MDSSIGLQTNAGYIAQGSSGIEGISASNRCRLAIHRLKTTIAKCVMSTFHQMLTGNKMDVWLWDWRIIRFPCQRKQRLKKKKRNKRLRINDVHGY